MVADGMPRDEVVTSGRPWERSSKMIKSALIKSARGRVHPSEQRDQQRS
jgi:hypothetical protein